MFKAAQLVWVHALRTRLMVPAQELTRSAMQPMGGTASLSLEDSEDPYLHGVKFSAMPPTKRYREMEQLSGGEKVRCFIHLSGFLDCIPGCL